MMWRRRSELSFPRVLAIFMAGILVGVQIALYLFDIYDDGIADPYSAAIGLLLLVLALTFVMRSFRVRG